MCPHKGGGGVTSKCKMKFKSIRKDVEGQRWSLVENFNYLYNLDSNPHPRLRLPRHLESFNTYPQNPSEKSLNFIFHLLNVSQRLHTVYFFSVPIFSIFADYLEWEIFLFLRLFNFSFRFDIKNFPSLNAWPTPDPTLAPPTLSTLNNSFIYA